jgi:hypothetical protein
MSGKAPADTHGDDDAPLPSVPEPGAAAGPSSSSGAGAGSGSGGGAHAPPAQQAAIPVLGDLGLAPALVVLALVLLEWYRSSMAPRGCTC